MNDKKKDKLDNFFDALHDDIGASIEEIQKDIENTGINMSKIESAVADLVADANRAKKLNWLALAKKKRAAISNLFDKNSQEMKAKFKDARDLVNAIKTGQFGVPLQERANAFFRNQDFDTISDGDLVSFVEDCQLLEELAQNDMEDE